MADRPLLGDEAKWWREAMQGTVEAIGIALIEAYSGSIRVQLHPN
jgi:hypothetical protein